MQELVGGASMIAGYRVVKSLGTSKRFEAYRVAMAPPVAGFGTLYLMRDALVQAEPFVKMVNAIRAAWPFDMPSSRQVVLPEARVWENRPWFIVPEGLPVLSGTHSSSPSAVASLRAQLDWLHDFQLPGEEGQFAHGDVRASRIALVAGAPFLIAPGWVAACELASGRSLAHTRADDAYHLAKLLVQRLESVNEAPMARGDANAIETPRPARPVEPAKPAARAKPEPAKPAARARAVEPAARARAVEPAARARAVEPARPVERARPEPAKPVERARPVEAQKAAERARAVEPEGPPAVAARAPARPPPPRVAAPLQPPPADLLAEVEEELMDVPSDVPPAEVTPQASPVAAAAPPPWPAAAPPLPAAPQAPPPWPAAAPQAPPLPAAAAAPAPSPAAAPQAPAPWPAAPQAPAPWPAAAPPLPTAPQASAAPPPAVAAPASPPAVSPSTQAGAQPSGGGSLRWLWVVAAFVLGLLLVFAVLFFLRR